MIEPSDFEMLVEQAMAVSGRQQMRPVIEKELLHYDLLFCLDKEGLLDQLTFQGGTSLRLCYGSPRFSEDLDFSGGSSFSSHQMYTMKSCIEDYIGKRYNFEVRVKEPSELSLEPEYEHVKVDKWQITVVTAPTRKDLPTQKIKIEIANIPSYSREPKALQVNYPFLPDGYSDTLVMCETMNEVMADKLISLVNTNRYIRNRDIWDLRWLKQQGAHVNHVWIKNKIHDYHVENYLSKLADMQSRLPDIIRGTSFKDEMIRFIPLNVQERTLKNDKFYDFLVLEIFELLNEVKKGLEST